jgi:site-specific recombinase XerD
MERLRRWRGKIKEIGGQEHDGGTERDGRIFEVINDSVNSIPSGIWAIGVIFHIKEKAGIKKPDGAHVLFRHTPASLMVQNGCDLLTIQQVMRHNHITTTMLYLHLADETKRLKYDKFLRL